MISRNKYKKANYFFYFQPEIKAYKNEAFTQNQLDFEEKRAIGENDCHLCELIRKDSIDEFITQIKKTNLSLNTVIERSIFETNLLLIKNHPTLIEYSAFFGSIQVFKYLHINGAQITNSIWIYAIHGSHPEMIKYLEEKKIKCPIESVKESIKCHHNEIANYLINNFFTQVSVSDFAIKYYNYGFFPSAYDLNNQKYFYYLCKYDYIYLVEFLLKTGNLNINQAIDIDDCAENEINI